VIFLFGQKQCC